MGLRCIEDMCFVLMGPLHGFILHSLVLTLFTIPSPFWVDGLSLISIPLEFDWVCSQDGVCWLVSGIGPVYFEF